MLWILAALCLCVVLLSWPPKPGARTAKKVLVPATDNPGMPYRVYCGDFDVEVNAAGLNEVLGPPQVDATALHQEFYDGTSAWRLRHNFDALEAAGRILKDVSGDALGDTVVSFLVDHSGSMRGQKILLAAGSVLVAAGLLERLKVPFEVLGFTTVSWKGGRSREKWRDAGKPAYPGRLNDLLHIVYKDAAEKPYEARYANFSREDVLKENIDGEALMWAAARLRKRRETRKHLLVISDGAPVDDSTLVENGGNYLAAHLKAVIHGIAKAGDISVSAIGLDYDAGHFYERCAVVRTPNDLGSVLLLELEQMLRAPWPPGNARAAPYRDPT
jgi:cobaltochelatase CobT